MLGIVDCGTSNLRSVENVLTYLGAEYQVVGDPEALSACSSAILPGVGSFAQAMKNLNKAGLTQPIRDFCHAGRPLLGICLGMQLLADLGHEPTETPGLGLIPGEVVRFTDASLRLPHVGWNALEQKRPHRVLDVLKKGVDFYFVHSYHFQAARPEHVIATTEYGYEFPSVVAKDSVIGAQFHPEKSQKHGLALLENFLQLAVSPC